LIDRTRRTTPRSRTPFDPSAFEREVNSALKEASVCDIDSCGWLNENDPDPDFIGHAMWQTDQPTIDLHALLGETPVRKRPKDVEKEILTAGDDFCGLMTISRLSIGLMLMWQRQARDNLLNESSFFWLHHTDAFLKLAIASDRIRDLLIVACTGTEPKIYKKKDPRNRLYVTPYKDARKLLADRGLEDQRLLEPLESLPRQAEEVYTYIDRRNKIVHEIATRVGISTRDSVLELQHRHDEEQTHGFSPRSYEQWFSTGADRARDDEHHRKIDRAINELREWYALLIQTSNCVFQVEYWSRVLGAKIDAAAG
jgi:hypothetical protein